MARSLHTRLIISHILPALLVIPLLGVAMLYVLETRLLLPMVYRNLEKDATLMAEITRNQPVFWQYGEAAQALVDGVSPYLSGSLSILTTNGNLLATSRAPVGDLSGEVVELPDMKAVRQGQTIQLKRGTLAEVFAPVYDLNNRMIGIVRMTTQVVTVTDEVYQLRYILGGVLLLGVLAGVGFGSYLAISINKPIQRVSRSIRELANGNWQTHLEVEGPEELQALSQEVNLLVDRLQNLEKTRQQLLSNLVHELGRPLGALHSASQALLKGADKDAELAKDLLTGMDSEIGRLQMLLNDLAGLHDQTLGRMDLKRKPVDIADWLATVLSPWRAEADTKGVRWQVSVPTDLPAVEMDPDRMAQAVGNLLSNAIKFTPTGGAIRVETSVNSGWLEIGVADSGPGIAAEEQEKIFQPFYHGAQNRRVVEGMGLGLSIARDIVQVHGGEIKLTSAPGQGSCFMLRIPIQSA